MLLPPRECDVQHAGDQKCPQGPHVHIAAMAGSSELSPLHGSLLMVTALHCSTSTASVAVGLAFVGLLSIIAAPHGGVLVDEAPKQEDENKGKC